MLVGFCVRQCWIEWNSWSFRVARRASITVTLWMTTTLSDSSDTFTFPYFPQRPFTITWGLSTVAASLLISCGDCMIRTVLRWTPWTWPLDRHRTQQIALTSVSQQRAVQSLNNQVRTHLHNTKCHKTQILIAINHKIHTHTRHCFCFSMISPHLVRSPGRTFVNKLGKNSYKPDVFIVSKSTVWKQWKEENLCNRGCNHKQIAHWLQPFLANWLWREQMPHPLRQLTKPSN